MTKLTLQEQMLKAGLVSSKKMAKVQRTAKKSRVQAREPKGAPGTASGAPGAPEEGHPPGGPYATPQETFEAGQRHGEARLRGEIPPGWAPPVPPAEATTPPAEAAEAAAEGSTPPPPFPGIPEGDSGTVAAH